MSETEAAVKGDLGPERAVVAGTPDMTPATAAAAAAGCSAAGTADGSCTADKSKSLNLFRIPHSRMKELVSWPLKEAAAIPDLDDLEPSLQAVYEAMWEVKSHEYIENHFIMDRLKARLQKRQVYNELVCNCHEDSMLLEVIGLVENVYTAQTQTERCMYGRKLQKKIRCFLEDFVTHMEQEEAVFQPLLDQNFEPQELEQMNQKVIEQHNFYREKIKEKKLKAVKRKIDQEPRPSNILDLTFDELRVKKSYCQEVSDHVKGNNQAVNDEDEKVAAAALRNKSVEGNDSGDVIGPAADDDDDIHASSHPKYIKTDDEGAAASATSSSGGGLKESQVAMRLPSLVARPVSIDDVTESTTTDYDDVIGVESLPEEVIVMVFAHLCPRDLMTASAVCKKWNRIALSHTLWQAIYPTQWARGCWSLDYQSPDLEKDFLAKSASSSLNSSMESLSNCSSNSNSDENANNEEMFASPSRHEEQIFRGIVSHLLPKIGSSVSTLILSASRGITSAHVKGMLRQVPHVRHVDLSYTNVAFHAFAGLAKFAALRKLEELNLSGCRFVGDTLLHHLAMCYHHRGAKKGGAKKGSGDKAEKKVTSHLARLNLSGCRAVTSWGLTYLDVHQGSLQELDLSGCFKVDGETLTSFVEACPKLKPHRLSYCNDIEDGPYQDTANGCLNLECEVRFCCQNAKLRF